MIKLVQIFRELVLISSAATPRQATLSSRADDVCSPAAISICRPLDAKFFDRCRHRKELPFLFLHVSVRPPAWATTPVAGLQWAWALRSWR